LLPLDAAAPEHADASGPAVPLACFAPLFQMREVAPTTAGHITRLPSSVRRKVRQLVDACRRRLDAPVMMWYDAKDILLSVASNYIIHSSWSRE
jgi:hypothetical protein